MSSLTAAGKPGQPVGCAACGHEFPQDPCFSVACPDCSAPPGQYCRRPSGHSGPLVSFHAARDLAALAAGFYDHTNDQGLPCGRQSNDVTAQADQPVEMGVMPAQLLLF